MSTGKTNNALVWASIETLLRQGLQFASSIFLARFLTPADFGLMAMLSIFVALGNVLMTGGFASALIQQRDENIVDSSTVFWFNIASGTVMALALGLSARQIASFFDQPELVTITWAMALNLWLASWLTVHVALLTRTLNFRLQAKATGISNVIAITLAIVLAMRGAGVWSLVAQTVTTTLMNVVLVWVLHRWRPKAIFSIRSFRRLFGFGGYMLASAALDTAATRLYSLLIGRLYSSRELGLYSQAAMARDASQTILGTIFSRVALPVLARHGHDPLALRKRLKSANELTMAINLPAMIGLAMVADTAVPVVFGKAWAGSVPVLQILCLSGSIWPLQISNLQALIAQGHSGRMFRLEVIKKGILAAAILIGSHWGITAIAWASVFGASIAFLVNAHYSRKLLHYGPLRQLQDLWPYLLLTAMMTAAVAGISWLIPSLSPGKRLVIEVCVGTAFYVGLAIAFRLPAVAYAFTVARSFLSQAHPDGRQ